MLELNLSLYHVVTVGF